MRKYYCIFVILWCIYASEIRSTKMVETKQGLIKGLQAEDGDYSMYLGIPYADIDEKNPFGDATPHPPFKTVFEAYDDSSKCPQQDEFSREYEGNFDCLRLNVYVPNTLIPNEKLLSVLVWIHGGGFRQGNGGRFLYGPKYLIRHNIIFVTMNYRQGAYGFLCLDVPEIPGNQGLKDQVLALRWIRNNIETFGGDSERITVMGESTGSVFVESHILSNNEKLFDAAILQSGSVYYPYVIWNIEKAKEISYYISEQLGFISDNTTEIAHFLIKTDTKTVVDAFFALGPKYGVCIEKTFENITSFLTAHPETLSVTNNKQMPILGGFNSREELVHYTDRPGTVLTPTVFEDCLKAIFHIDNDEMVDIMRKYYIGDEDISPNVKDGLIDFLSDCQNNYPMQRYLLQQIRGGATNVYQYLFSYNGTRNFVKKRFNVTELGASHADEIAYLFDLSYDKDISPEDQLIIDRMTTLWTSFAKYWNPTPEITDVIPVKWNPITDKKLNYLNIDLELSMKSRPFHSRLAFWDLYFMVYEKNIIGRDNNY